MKRVLIWLLLTTMILSVLTACTDTPDTPDDPPKTPEEDAGEDKKDPVDDKEKPGNQKSEEKLAMEKKYGFSFLIDEDVLCNYLSRAVTISCEGGHELNTGKTKYIKSFILNTGAKYICRAATSWSPSAADVATHAAQKAFIEDVHKSDPYVIFEACIFENVNKDGVNSIPVPAFVFEAFDLPVEERNFSYDDMIFTDGSFRNQWGENSSVPDMTRIETQMFFYYRACDYIDCGFEGLHMGQVHLIGKNDKGWVCWTRVLEMIREYANDHARRNFVLINAHTHGITDANGYLMFDFHMYPSRPVSNAEEGEHAPTADFPQGAYYEKGYGDSIYGDSLGGETYSGWSCETLPYLVELDNFGVDDARLNKPTKDGLYCWGMDEITWFANQPAAYRKEFLEYAYDWVTSFEPGLSYFAMPGQRVARIYDAAGNVKQWAYYAYNPSSYKSGNGDEEFIKAIWAAN